MDLAELRLGNIINYSGSYRSKNVFDEELAAYLFDIFNEWDLVTPIPLTEEWLLKLGFIKEVDFIEIDFEFIYGNGQCRISKNKDGHWTYWAEEIWGFCVNLEHVHQLQNLYYCLCGEELKLIA